MRLNLHGLREEAKHQPNGPAALLLALGRIEDKSVFVEEKAYDEVVRQFPPPHFFYPLKTPIQFTITQIKWCAHILPAGYVDFVLACGQIEGGLIIVDERAVMQIREKFPPAPVRSVTSQPTLTELATNFSGALASWAQAGFKLAEREEYERRHAACRACNYWQPDAMLGIGKCKKCGCSGAKLWLATSKCPDQPPRW